MKKTDEEYRKKFRDRHKIYTFCLDNKRDRHLIKWLDKQSNQSEVIRRCLYGGKEDESIIRRDPYAKTEETKED